MTDPEGVEDVSALVFEFMQRHLAGAETPDRPRVHFYMQPNDGYVEADSWPPADAERLRLRLGEGTLAAGEQPAGDAESASYFVDPLAGFSSTFDRYGTVAASPFVPAPQQAEGPHGLTFRTAPLDRPLELAGPIGLRLVASSSATETDWDARLADVAPDGTETPITDGHLRASHRAIDPERSTPERPYHPHTSPEPLEPGRFYPFEIEVWPTAYRLAPGHRLQLRVTSTDLPTHLPGTVLLDPDHPEQTTIALNPPATNTVRFGESALTLLVRGAGAGDGGSGGSAGAGRACGKRPKPRRVRVEGGEKTQIVAKVTKRGRRIAGAPIRVEGPGFEKRSRTGERGRATVVVRAGRDGRAKVSTRRCGAKLRAR